MRRLLLVPLLALAACNSQGDPTGTTPGEAQALNDAAFALDANSATSDNAVIVDEDEGGNEEQSQ